MLAAIAPWVISTFPASNGFLAEYRLASVPHSFSEPRIAPYVSFVEGDHISLVLSSESSFKSSRDIEATQVSAILYFASVSYLSIH